MFVDKVKVEVKAGNGGDGIVSFRHERFVDRGGPDGGDGGDGGDVIFQASTNSDTLAEFRYQKLIKAPDGSSGGKSKRHGKNGGNLVVKVPLGTIITTEEGNIVADLQAPDAINTAAKGGKGGFGNAHFVSSRRQAPRIAEKGEKGEHFYLLLELKMIADVGLIGLPNAGKSTLLSIISNAAPEIADYPFTTLKPNLGVVDLGDDSSMLFADIPGLIEGAAKGKGLGDEFLRHVERTMVLVHLIDVYQGDVTKAYKTIRTELKNYKVDLTNKPEVVVLNKCEGLDKGAINVKIQQLKQEVAPGTKILATSAVSKTGVKKLLEIVAQIVKKQKQSLADDKKADGFDGLPIITLDDQDSWRVNKTGDKFVVSGKKIERFAAKTDFDNPQGVGRLKDIMRRKGIYHELNRLGASDGDIISINEDTFEY